MFKKTIGLCVILLLMVVGCGDEFTPLDEFDDQVDCE